MSGTLVTATVGNTARTLGNWTSDAIFIEGFGGVGDGTTDNTAALNDAIASGKPVRFGPNTYVINGDVAIASNTTLIGIPGETIILLSSELSGGVWFAIGTGSNNITFSAYGIIFNANSKISFSGLSAIANVSYLCSASYWEQCSFLNNNGSSDNHGLLIANTQSPQQATKHVVANCEAANNTGFGILGQAITGFQVSNCRAYSNSVGIGFEYYDPTKILKGQYAQIIGNICWLNNLGILVGDFYQDDDYNYGAANPDTLFCLVANNQCYQNVQYGIAAQGQYLQINGNICNQNGISRAYGPAAGILANCSNSQIIGNTIVGNSGTLTGQFGYGIDAGGAVNLLISSNNINYYNTGIDVGGTQQTVVTGNYIFNCMSQAIYIDVIEGPGSSPNLAFPTVAASIVVSNNTFIIPNSTSFGVLILNGAQGVTVSNNDFFAPSSGDGSNCLLAKTNSYVVSGNRYNGATAIESHYGPSMIGGYQTFRYLDMADTILLKQSSIAIQSILSMNAVALSSQVNFIIVTNGGLGYLGAPTVTITGGGGSGATAQAYVSAVASGAQVLGIRMTANGTGYTSAPTVTLSGVGYSEPATAVAYVGLLPPPNREIRIICKEGIPFAQSGSNPSQNNYTGSAVTCPAGTSIDWFFVGGGWNALSLIT